MQTHFHTTNAKEKCMLLKMHVFKPSLLMKRILPKKKVFPTANSDLNIDIKKCDCHV